MAREIKLFNDYHTKENILSNHCGVILKMLFEENPKSFEEVITNLASVDFSVTPSFQQQIKKKSSYPDIVIEQPSFSIFFETKRLDWFYDDQIERHLSGFEKNKDYNILFLLSNFENENLEDQFAHQIKTAREKLNIILSPISFEQLIGVLENTEHSEIFHEYLLEFRDFLERNNYLPSWKYMLDVVNCASTIHEVHEHNFYMCPDTGGKYKHQRALFFGGYKNKNVKFIHEIKALVVIEEGGKTGFVKWKNFDIPDKKLIKEAIEKVSIFDYRQREIATKNLQVFLLQNPHLANFEKSSDGGLYSSKKYFRYVARQFSAENSEQLANSLNGKTWEEITFANNV